MRPRGLGILPEAPSPPSPPSCDTATTDTRRPLPELMQSADVRDNDIPKLIFTEVVDWDVSCGHSPTMYDLNSWVCGRTRDWVNNAQAQSAVPIDSCCLAEELSWCSVHDLKKEKRLAQ
ncbi:hypothetical protein K439DRAFT_1610222 [Ramaria rubella]|nr:hypothetical protein K439DRAFT_1610222 [Ramaria rubella]